MGPGVMEASRTTTRPIGSTSLSFRAVKTLERIATLCGERLHVAFRPLAKTEGNVIRLPGRSEANNEQGNLIDPSASGDPPSAA
jgi:hypothetical protein